MILYRVLLVSRGRDELNEYMENSSAGDGLIKYISRNVTPAAYYFARIYFCSIATGLIKWNTFFQNRSDPPLAYARHTPRTQSEQ